MPIIYKHFGKDCLETRHLVEEEQASMRLDQFAQIYLSTFSRQNIKQKIKDGDIFVENRLGKMRPSTRLQKDEIVQILIKKTTHEDEWWNGKKIDIEVDPPIIFENNDIIAIEKPAFMTTHPTGRHIFYCATVFFEQKYKKTIHSIHRLDRETSGILLLGKNPETAQKVTPEFSDNNVKKAYFFIAKINDNYNNEKNFEVNHRLDNKASGMERVIIVSFSPDSKEGKTAKTSFEIIHIENGYAIGIAFPFTGRQHQIRVHALIKGLPLIGDKLYLGGYPCFQRFKDNLATKDDHDLMEIPRHALHSIGLRVKYNNEYKHFIGTIPIDLKKWISSNLICDVQNIEKIIKEKVDTYFRSFD